MFVSEIRKLSFMFAEPLPMLVELRNMIIEGALASGDLDFVHLRRSCEVNLIQRVLVQTLEKVGAGR